MSQETSKYRIVKNRSFYRYLSFVFFLQKYSIEVGKDHELSKGEIWMRLSVVDVERCVGCQSCMFACARRYGEGGLAKSCIMIRSRGGMSRGFTVVVCRACEDPPCAKVCPTDALKPRKGGGVILIPSLCIGCGHCKEECVIGAIFWDEENNKPLTCAHCGYCVQYCPHGVLKMEERSVEYAEK